MIFAVSKLVLEEVAQGMGREVSSMLKHHGHKVLVFEGHDIPEESEAVFLHWRDLPVVKGQVATPLCGKWLGNIASHIHDPRKKDLYHHENVPLLVYSPKPDYLPSISHPTKSYVWRRMDSSPKLPMQRANVEGASSLARDETWARDVWRLEVQYARTPAGLLYGRGNVTLERNLWHSKVWVNQRDVAGWYCPALSNSTWLPNESPYSTSLLTWQSAWKYLPEYLWKELPGEDGELVLVRKGKSKRFNAWHVVEDEAEQAQHKKAPIYPADRYSKDHCPGPTMTLKQWARLAPGNTSVQCYSLNWHYDNLQYKSLHWQVYNGTYLVSKPDERVAYWEVMRSTRDAWPLRPAPNATRRNVLRYLEDEALEGGYRRLYTGFLPTATSSREWVTWTEEDTLRSLLLEDYQWQDFFVTGSYRAIHPVPYEGEGPHEKLEHWHWGKGKARARRLIAERITALGGSLPYHVDDFLDITEVYCSTGYSGTYDKWASLGSAVWLQPQAEWLGKRKSKWRGDIPDSDMSPEGWGLGLSEHGERGHLFVKDLYPSLAAEEEDFDGTPPQPCVSADEALLRLSMISARLEQLLNAATDLVMKSKRESIPLFKAVTHTECRALANPVFHVKHHRKVRQEAMSAEEVLLGAQVAVGDLRVNLESGWKATEDMALQLEGQRRQKDAKGRGPTELRQLARKGRELTQLLGWEETYNSILSVLRGELDEAEQELLEGKKLWGCDLSSSTTSTSGEEATQLTDHTDEVRPSQRTVWERGSAERWENREARNVVRRERRKARAARATQKEARREAKRKAKKAMV